MKEQLKTQMKEALKAKDKLRLNTIREVLSAIQYQEMQKETEGIPDAQVISIIQSEIKKRNESLEFAEKNDRSDLCGDLKSEIGVLESFLPTQLSESEIEEIVAKLKEENSDLNLGVVMKALKDQYSGQYDGKLASAVAKRVLG